MSIPLPEKIRNIREAEGLSRSEFGEKIDISKRTIEGIENEGRIPGGQVLEKIADVFPKYVAYLLTGNGALSCQQERPTAPDADKKIVWKIIQQLRISKLDQCVVKNEWLERLLLVQSIDQINDLCGILIVRDLWNGDRICIKIGYGEINFHAPGGLNALSRLKEWLRRNRPDLIKTAELFTSKSMNLDTLYQTLVLNEGDIDPAEESEELTVTAQLEFKNWVLDEEASPQGFF